MSKISFQVLFLSLSFFNCASQPPFVLSPEKISRQPQKEVFRSSLEPSSASFTSSSSWKLLWTHGMPGAIVASKLAMKKKHPYKKMIVTSTMPDRDIPSSLPGMPGSDTHQLTRFEVKGAKLRQIWSKPLSFPVKQLDMSKEGDLIVFSNYEGKVVGWNSKGKEIWQTQGYCRPIILTRSQQVLCYHDDDAEPQIAFDLISWTGQKTFHYPIQKDILALKISLDEKQLALALEEGEIVYFENNFQTPKWKARVQGEIVDLDVSSSGVIVLFREGSISGPIQIARMNLLGNIVQTGKPSFSPLQISWSGSQNIVYSGDSSVGQYLGGAQLPVLNSTVSSRSWTEQWVIKWKQEPEFVQVSKVFPGKAFSGNTYRGVQELFQTNHWAKLFEISSKGKILSSLLIPSSPASYLSDLDGVDDTLLVATDDGKLHFYKKTGRNR